MMADRYFLIGSKNAIVNGWYYMPRILTVHQSYIKQRVLEDGGIPVYSANVFEEFGRIDKQNLADFSVPSILWGIDGDWMVHIIPANQPFYPTDHCGVLRIYCDEILPEYMVFVLQVEGEYEHFSRHNRASIQRIQSLTIQVPELSIQKEIVSRIAYIENQISAATEEIRAMFESAKDKFIAFFGEPDINSFSWNTHTLREISLEDLAYGSGEAACPYDGNIRYVRITDIDDYGQLGNEKVSAKKAEEKYLLNEGDILFARSGATVGKTYLYRGNEGKSIYAGYLIRLVPNKKVVLPEYLFYFTKTDYYKRWIATTSVGMAQPNINAQQYGSLQLGIPPIDLQLQFTEFIRENDKKREEASLRLKNLLEQKEQLITKYFR